MYCMCCKLRHSVPASSHSLEPEGFGLLETSPIKSVSNSLGELTSFKESTEQLLLSLLEGGGLPRGTLREAKFVEDLEETNLSEQATQDEKLYKQLFRRIYIDNYSAERLIREELRLLDRVYYPQSLERVLLETIDRTAIMYRSILKEKLDELRRGTSFERQHTAVREIGMRELYHNFQAFLEIVNTLIDYSRAIRSYAHEADLLLKHLEAKQLVDSLFEVLTFLTQLNEEWLHRRCIQTVLQDPFIRSVCNLSRNILRTKSLAKYQDAFGIEALAYLVDCCLNDQDSISDGRDLLSRSSSHLHQDDEWDDPLFRELRQATLPPQRLECDFSPQYLKSIERKLRKKK